MKIAFYSTDWNSEPVPDPVKSLKTGRQEYVPDQKIMTFGGTYYYRLAMPGMELAKHGYESLLSYQVDTSPDGSIRAQDTNGEWHDDCDMIVFQRWMGENGAAVAKKAMAAGQYIVQDVDDDFWNLTKTNVASETTDPIKNPNFNRAHYWDMIAASSAITVSTEALRKRFERLNVPTYVLRNCIDLDRWPTHDPGQDGMIGWVGGVQWRAHDLQTLKPVLPEFLEDYGLPFYHGGDSEVPGVPKAWEQIGIDPKRVQCATSPLCHIRDYPQLWESINLALVPLERCRFNEAKSHLKGLEASACGIPFIYSNHMPEYELFGGGVPADNARPKQWRSALEDMLDPGYRRSEGARNRAIAEQWNITDRWTQWDDCYQDIAA